jgi:autophagy-related protein 16-1
LQLELSQIEDRNQTLTRDNAKLLQRWLDAKQTEANKMNEANIFYEDMRSKHQAVLNWREQAGAGPHGDGTNGDQVSISLAPPGSGNGAAKDGEVEISKKAGMQSPQVKVVDPTPNG